MKRSLSLILVLNALLSPAFAATKPASKKTVSAVLAWRNSNDETARMWDVAALKAYEDKDADTSDLVLNHHYAVDMQVLGESTFHDPENDDDYPVTLVHFVAVKELSRITATIQSYDAKAGLYVLRTDDGQTIKAKISASAGLSINPHALPSATQYDLEIAVKDGVTTIYGGSEIRGLTCEGAGLQVVFSKTPAGETSAIVRTPALEFAVGTAKRCATSGNEIDCDFTTITGAAYGKLHLAMDDADTFPAELVFADPTADRFPLTCAKGDAAAE